MSRAQTETKPVAADRHAVLQFSLAHRREIDHRAVLRGKPRIDPRGRCRPQEFATTMGRRD